MSDHDTHRRPPANSIEPLPESAEQLHSIELQFKICGFEGSTYRRIVGGQAIAREIRHGVDFRREQPA
jgi:hypothetical protein